MLTLLFALFPAASPSPAAAATTITITTKATATTTDAKGLIVESCEAEEYAPKDDPDYPEYRFIRAKIVLRNSGSKPVPKGTMFWYGHQVEGDCNGASGGDQDGSLQEDLAPGAKLTVNGGVSLNQAFDQLAKRFHYYVTTEKEHSAYLSLAGKNCSWDGRAKAKDPDTFLVCKLKLLK